MIFQTILLFSIFYRNSASDPATYYERLIKDGIAQSRSYVFPKDASDFDPKNHGHPIFFGKFDYVVIGAGSAGAVVASRLSEEPSWNVLLLEAGERENEFTEIPAMSTYTIKSQYNWGFNTTPQTACCLATAGICPYPRGKALGGTTILNALVYSRGDRLDYDAWAAAGNPGWSFDDVLPYFMRSEDACFRGDDGYHGHDGYVPVEHHVPLNKRAKVFLAANREKGLKVGDYNGESRAGRMQFTQSNGRRVTSARAFLHQDRKNLRILTGSYVTKIVVTGKVRKVTAILFSRGGLEYLAEVRREAILSAGAIGSPHLLMVSGVGPAEHLRQFGIPVVANLGVGQSMHDHLVFHNLHFTVSQGEPEVPLKQAIHQYLSGKGPLTISTNPQAVAFYSNSNVSEFEIVIVPTTRNTHTLQIIVVLLHPKMRGTISLQSHDPYKYPLIDSNCLHHPDDLEQLHKGIALALELTQTNAFKNLNPKLQPYQPCCALNPFMSHEYWTCVIRETAMSAYHAGGTCRMGPNPGMGDVVDNKLKVYGIPNLRVADASVVPLTLSGHMSAPTMMIGEKLADFIKQGH